MSATGSLPAARVRSAGILGLGQALPERVVTNAEIAARIGVEPAWIESRSGIRERRHAADGARVSDLATSAGRMALEHAGLDALELDMVLVATLAADEITPSTAPIVASELGATRAAAIDVGAACAGAISALALASASWRAGAPEHVLVIGAEILTRFLDRDDRRTAPLFGTGRARMVVSVAATGAIGPFVFGSDGARAGTIRATRERGLLEMDGHDTFLRAVEHLSACTREVLARAGRRSSDIDLFVYHQANARILTAVAERLELPARARLRLHRAARQHERRERAARARRGPPPRSSGPARGCCRRRSARGSFGAARLYDVGERAS